MSPLRFCLLATTCAALGGCGLLNGVGLWFSDGEITSCTADTCGCDIGGDLDSCVCDSSECFCENADCTLFSNNGPGCFGECSCDDNSCECFGDTCSAFLDNESCEGDGCRCTVEEGCSGGSADGPPP